MPQSIVLIDKIDQHRADIRQFLQDGLPDVTLLEVEPTSFQEVSENIEWSDHDLLLIDNQLGTESGISWVERFRVDRDFPPVIFVSSSDRDSAEANKAADTGLRLGARGFVFKRPLDFQALATHVSRALGRELQESGSNFQSSDVIMDEIDSLPDITPPPTVVTNDTFHEMQQALALLHGHDRWPFSVQDLQSGNARFAGYHIHKYLGGRDGLYFFDASDQAEQKRYVIKLVEQKKMTEHILSPQLMSIFDRILTWNHPHLVRWAEYREVDGHLVVIEEFQEGESLFHRLNKSRVTRTQAELFTRQILETLAFLHQQGFRAGSLSPEKIVLRSRDDLVITHFDALGNLVSPEKVSEDSHQTTFNEALYLSPELIQGQEADHRSDLYIAGVIIYELFSGQAPYHKGTTKTVLTDHVASPIPPLPEENADLNKLVGQLLDKHPENRIQSAEAVLQQFTDAMDGE